MTLRKLALIGLFGSSGYINFKTGLTSKKSRKMYNHRRLIESTVVLMFCLFRIQAKLDESLMTDDLKNLMKNLHNTCVDQIEIDEDQVEDIKNGVFREDNKTKCYMKCVMSESGVMDENGDINMKAYSEVIPEKIQQKNKQTFEHCVNHAVGVANYCEKSFEIVKCLYNMDPENYFFV